MIDRYVSREELRRLLSALVVIIGAISLYALFAFIILPGILSKNRPLVSGRPLQGFSGWLDPAEQPAAKGYTKPPVDPQRLMTPTAEMTALGAQLYKRDCAACHGAQGKGDGPSAASLKPAPRDFTHPDGWKNGHSITQILKTLTSGFPGTAMASYDSMSPKNKMALIHHVRSLGAFAHGNDPAANIEALKKRLALSAEVVPNKIPVSQAIARIAAAVRPADLHLNDDGIVTLFIHDKDAAARFLLANPSWRDAAARLTRLALAAAPGNGFNASGARHSNTQWQTLYNRLRAREVRK
ncbi:MAG: cytochrome c [Elusimicrobiota bacterium]